MANVFLNGEDRDIETAIMLEQAIIHDIGNAVAYTDGNRIFINTDDNLYRILPAYNNKMLKWLLWHERYHKELRHHNRFFKYLEELSAAKMKDEFALDKNDVNIIMDILVHDSLAKMFPELVETAVNNLAQMRNRNSLDYTFKSFTLEEMLDEYKKATDPDGSKSKEETDEDDTGEGTPTESEKGKRGKPGDESGSEPRDGKKAHGEGGGTTDGKKDRPEDGVPEIKDEPTPEPEHHKTDWSKLEKIDSKEFIEVNEADRYMDQINRLKRKKFKLGKLTETLNGLTTTTRKRSYAMPSPIHAGGGVLIKGSTPGKTLLYLCFDASGSMGVEMETFKEIISKSIPQAMDTPTEWFSGWNNSSANINPEGRSPHDYYKGKFKDFMPVRASSGYSDDGDRTIELCWKAEQMGYCPIGVTDGGGQISWAKDMLKQLKRTVFVGQNKYWLHEAKTINPKIQTLDI